jgi:3',5'-cyclic AMP phosphodiesterase CpdA
MSTAPGSYQIHAEARGPHWIAWVRRAGSGKPDRSVVLVGETKEKAEANARRWADQSIY